MSHDGLGTSAARMIIATAAFVSAVGGLVYALMSAPVATPEAANLSNNSGDTPASADGFFYGVVGQAPDLPSPAAADADGKTGTRSTYTLELKVATTREEAEKAIAHYQKMGFEAYYTPLTRGGKVVYRVRRGMYTTQREASREATALKQSNVGAKVVKLQ